MEAGTIIVCAIAFVELIAIIGLKILIKEREAEIVELKNANKSVKNLLRQRRIPTEENGVYVESGDIHGEG